METHTLRCRITSTIISQYKAVLRNGKEYNSLEEAYKAYVTALADSKYNGVRDTQASAP